jgi:hypothetical protein
MGVSYEWDVEKIELFEDGEDEVFDHDHSDKLDRYVSEALDQKEPGFEFRLVLVRDDDSSAILGRTWAYAYPHPKSKYEELHLPEYFVDAFGHEETKVPKRFHEEIARWGRKYRLRRARG